MLTLVGGVECQRWSDAGKILAGYSESRPERGFSLVLEQMLRADVQHAPRYRRAIVAYGLRHYREAEQIGAFWAVEFRRHRCLILQSEP